MELSIGTWWVLPMILFMGCAIFLFFFFYFCVCVPSEAWGGIVWIFGIPGVCESPDVGAEIWSGSSDRAINTQLPSHLSSPSATGIDLYVVNYPCLLALRPSDRTGRLCCRILSNFERRIVFCQTILKNWKKGNSSLKDFKFVCVCPCMSVSVCV